MRPSINVSVSSEKSLEDVLAAEKLDRVLVFTTVKLLGLLTVAKRGSVDGTFRSCTTLWKQLFIIMVEIRGVFIPIVFAWLPDKTTASYYACLFLIMSAFCEHSDEINQIWLYARSNVTSRLGSILDGKCFGSLVVIFIILRRMVREDHGVSWTDHVNNFH